MYVIEFQKRGLPHAHILLVLHSDSKIDHDLDLIDSIISAELPNPLTHPKLFEIIRKHQIHGPCKLYRSCLKNGKCSKFFPKPYRVKTTKCKDGYPLYKRRSPTQGGFTCTSTLNESEIVTNQYVVPYNPALSLIYNCHLNVEYAASIQSVKYLYKYIYKGSDSAYISIVSEDDNEYIPQELDNFIKCRYFGAAEACWRIFGFKMGKQFPSVESLPVHLPGKQITYFDEETNELVREHKTTEFLEYFKNNAKEKKKPLTVKQLGEFPDGTLQPSGPELLYTQYPQFYCWTSDKKWKRRSNIRRLTPKVSRMHWVNITEQERYYVRILLQHKRGATSFDDLKTENNQLCKTFKDTVKELGLLDDDTEFINCLTEACHFMTNGHSLRRLFATILNLNQVDDPKTLWSLFKEHLTNDIKNLYYKKQCKHVLRGDRIYTQQMFNECLFRIEELLITTATKNACLKDYGLPVPDPDQRLSHLAKAKAIRNELNFDSTLQQASVNTNTKKMNNKQQHAYNMIMKAVNNPTDDSLTKLFFLQAPAGTGKTFVARTIAAAIRAKKGIALCNATSGIAATLFENGRTMHSRFKIPLNCTKYSDLSIKRQSADAKLISKADIIIWDEAPMAKSDNLLWLNNQLKDIMRDQNHLFGNKVILLSGDFRQCPPVCPAASREYTISSSISKCSLFRHFKKIVFTENERLKLILKQQKLSEKEKQELRKFDKWINSIGNDTIEKISDLHPNAIEIPKKFIVDAKTEEEMIDQIYNFECEHTGKYYQSRCILTPLNQSVDKLNEICFEKVANDTEKTYLSDDCVGLDDCPELYSQKFLNSISISGIPKHELKLKENIPIMLMRNLDSSESLCNGTRLLVHKMHVYSIECTRLTDSEDKIIIPRMTLSPATDKLGYEFKRKQLPVRLAFAMTINKAQGQTLDTTTIYLPDAVFEHGQLYVAVSRVKTPQNLKFFIKDAKEQGFDKEKKIYWTKNIVHKELLINE